MNVAQYKMECLDNIIGNLQGSTVAERITEMTDEEVSGTVFPGPSGVCSSPHKAPTVPPLAVALIPSGANSRRQGDSEHNHRGNEISLEPHLRASDPAHWDLTTTKLQQW